MKPIQQIVAAFSLCALASATGCQSTIQPEMSRCVDYNDHVVGSSLCRVNPQPMLVRGSLHPEPMYRTYYGGFGSFEVGTRAWGGSDRALVGHRYQTDEAQQTPPPNLEPSPQPYTVSRR